MEINYNITLFLLILLRMTGCVMFNPIFGRKNIPTIFRVAFSVALAFYLYPYVPQQELTVTTPIVFAVCAVREMLIGFLIGFLVTMILSVLIMGGEQMDMQMGVSMSKIYDPQSNISMPLSASIINAMFILIFFLSNSHLTLMQLFIKLGETVPYGDALLPADAFGKLVSCFGLMLIYAAKLCLPMIAVEMISQMGIGIMMRAIPQIDIFTIEIQLKIIIGFVAMIVLVPSFSSFIETLIRAMFESISAIYTVLT